MKWRTITIPPDLWNKLNILRKEQTWGDFLLSLLKEIEDLKKQVDALQMEEIETSEPKDARIGERWKDECLYLYKSQDWEFFCAINFPDKPPRKIPSLFFCDICKERRVKKGDLTEIPLTPKKSGEIILQCSHCGNRIIHNTRYQAPLCPKCKKDSLVSI